MIALSLRKRKAVANTMRWNMLKLKWIGAAVLVSVLTKLSLKPISFQGDYLNICKSVWKHSGEYTHRACNT